MLKGISSLIWGLQLLVMSGFALQVNASELFNPFPNTEKTEKSARNYDRYPIITGIEKNTFVTQSVNGALQRTLFQINSKHSPENIFNNYYSNLKKNNATILFECRGIEHCGSTDKINELIQPLKTNGRLSPQIVTAKITDHGNTRYVSIYVFANQKYNSVQIDVITEQSEPLTLVKINSDYLKQSHSAVKITPVKLIEPNDAKDHPLISRIPGSRIHSFKSFEFEKNQLVNKIGKKAYGTIAIDGKTTIISYRLPREYSEFEVFENYRQALSRAGFTEIVDCQGLACGKKDTFIQQINSLATNGRDESQYYLLAKLARPEGNVWVSVYVLGFSGALSSNLHIVEEKTINDKRLSVDVDSIRNAIEQSGHIALEGLLFKYDSDQLLPESLAVLKQIADYIKSVPNKRFYVVGHTDDSGERSYNAMLSRKRADSIVEQLNENYQVNKSMLTAEGAGEYAPMANNGTEFGRKLNRRVELVLRSDVK